MAKKEKQADTLEAPVVHEDAPEPAPVAAPVAPKAVAAAPVAMRVPVEEWFRVERRATYCMDAAVITLAEGAYVSSHQHDVPELRRQGVPLVASSAPPPPAQKFA